MDLNERDYKLIIKGLDILTVTANTDLDKKYILELKEYVSDTLSDLEWENNLK